MDLRGAEISTYLYAEKNDPVESKEIDDAGPRGTRLFP